MTDYDKNEIVELKNNIHLVMNDDGTLELRMHRPSKEVFAKLSETFPVNHTTDNTVGWVKFIATVTVFRDRD